MIEYVPNDKANGMDGLGVIQKDIDEKKRVEEEKEQKRLEELAAKQKKAKLNKSRISELAKPNDKWKVGKKLIELQKQFPHDRVLQRMVKQEFASNQTFRYPEEYDKFNQEDEAKMKQIKLGDEQKGLSKKDFEAGAHKLEIFKIKDKLENDK